MVDDRDHGEIRVKLERIIINTIRVNWPRIIAKS